MIANDRRIRLQPERRARMLDGVVQTPLQTKGDPEVSVRLRVPRIDGNGALQVPNGFVNPVLRTKQHRQIEVGIAILRIERDGAAEFTHGIAGAAHRM